MHSQNRYRAPIIAHCLPAQLPVNMANQRAPKQWSLTKHETITSFESWRQNLVYCLSLDGNFARFIPDGTQWLKKTTANPNRGLTDDPATDAEATRKTAAQKNAQLEMMLGQIANYCPIIARNSIVKGSTSLADIWQKVRQHFGFQSSGSHFLDLASIKLEVDERPEDLFQRLSAFFEDNLMTTHGGITHNGEATTTDEDMSPTLENTIVFIWLQLIHPALPQLVRQKYGAELRNKTLASIKPEISQALSSLLDELRSIEDTKVLRTAASNVRARNPAQYSHTKKKSFKSCILCKTAGRPAYSSHSLIECRFLPEYDKRTLAKTRLVLDDGDDDEEYSDNANLLTETLTLRDDVSTESPPQENLRHSALRVNVIQSPFLMAHYKQHPLHLTIDTGATTNMIRASVATHVGLPIHKASQMARQADGVTPLAVTGEVHATLTRGTKSFTLDALVVENLDVEILAGNPFLVSNDIATRPAKRQIIIDGTETVYYGPQQPKTATIRRTQAYVLRAPNHLSVVLPGEFIELGTPNDAFPDSEWAVEPRFDSPASQASKISKSWPQPQVVQSVANSIRITNTTEEAILIRRNEHFCQARLITDISQKADHQESTPKPTQPCKPYSNSIKFDADCRLPEETKLKFSALNQKYDEVFNPCISKYNGASGNIEAVVNMGPVLPPQRKGRLPMYNKDKLVELQQKFDDLENSGVFAKPEQVNVTVEYLNPSFLINKPNGGTRLVTAFGEVGQYSKPQPSLMPNVDSTLRAIAAWNYIVVSDLLKSFYQIPLSKQSMKYCGVATPFKGIRVYTRSAMGMPGSETALEELMSRVLGDLIQEGVVAKLADDLYCGGHTPDETLANWERVLAALEKNNLRLSATKTRICPKSTNILGWIWSGGTLTASPHRVTALASVAPPKTVQALRSFIGAYKVLSRVLKGYADLLHPLDLAVAGKQSHDTIVWNDELLQAFINAQQALSNNKTITLPRPEDDLWIVTDGAIKNPGIGATLYILRGSKLLLAGFFNAKLRKHQVTWLPCEVEALCIGSAVKHFAPFIIQAQRPSRLLTDSRPCVQAYEKLCRGEFSTSSRVTSFLSTVCRYQVSVSHISGAANLPSDYSSRHAPNCPDNNCQICKFIRETEDSVVHSTSVKDVLDGHVMMPFTSRVAWRTTQMECPDLRRTHSHLVQGTRPTKKMTRIPDVKRYLQSTTVASDGVLVVRDNHPFSTSKERIVIPRMVLDGFLTAIHLRFNHPTAHQLKQLISRYFFALSLDNAIHVVTAACHQCAALKQLPTCLEQQTSSPPPVTLGTSFAADVMRRYRQCIFVLRETVSSFTRTLLIDSEKHQDLREAILTLCADMRTLGETPTTIRIDPAPGFVSLKDDPILRSYNITLDIGRTKNSNKNPVAEKAIEELGLELLHLSPEGGPISKLNLAIATASMNARIRNRGLSAREIWTQRDQVTGSQLPMDDRQLILKQAEIRDLNHPPSAKSKAHGHHPAPVPEISIGDLVYLKAERDKTKARDKYMVTAISGEWCEIRKFTKSQFRSKTYDVRLSDCFPITSTTLARSHPGPIRGMDPHQDCDSDSDQPPCVTTPNPVPVLPPILHTPPMVINPPDMLILPPDDSELSPPPPAHSPQQTSDTPSPRRSNRSNKGHPPIWLNNKCWDLS